MIRCHLSTFMGRDKLRISDVSRLTGLNRSTVSALYKETVTRLDVAAIDALCRERLERAAEAVHGADVIERDE